MSETSEKGYAYQTISIFKFTFLSNYRYDFFTQDDKRKNNSFWREIDLETCAFDPCITTFKYWFFWKLLLILI